MFNSSEILAAEAHSFYCRLPKPVDFQALVDAQICPEIIGAIRMLVADEGRVISAADIRHLQSFGGRDHLDPTLTGSPIASERPYSTSIIR